MGRKEVPRSGICSLPGMLCGLPVFVRQLFPASPRGRYSFTVAETGAQKVKTLAQEHIASKRQSPD